MTTSCVSTPKRLRSQGFTMLELVLVVILVSIVSVSVLPKAFTVANYTKHLFFREVLVTMQYANKVAVASGCDIQVSISSGDITLNSRTSCSSGSFTDGVYDPVTNSYSVTIQAPNGVSVSSASLPFYFDEDGQARDSSSNAIVQPTVTVGGRTVSVVGESGFVYDSGAS